MDYKAKQVPEV